MSRRLVFVAVGIIVPLLAMAADRPEAPKVSIPLPDPNFAKPVVAGAAVAPAKVAPGKTITLVVKAKTAPTWHIYAVDRDSGPSIPTTLKLKLPKGLATQGNWVLPTPAPGPEGQGWIYEGDLVFHCVLAVAPETKPGPLELTCDFGYQACDPTSCRPPSKLVLKATVDVEAAP